MLWNYWAVSKWLHHHCRAALEVVALLFVNYLNIIRFVFAFDSFLKFTICTPLLYFAQTWSAGNICDGGWSTDEEAITVRCMLNIKRFGGGFHREVHCETTALFIEHTYGPARHSWFPRVLQSMDYVDIRSDTQASHTVLV